MQDLASLLKLALPKLFLIQISGAKTGDTRKMGWEKLIQPLKHGTYDGGSLPCGHLDNQPEGNFEPAKYNVIA